MSIAADGTLILSGNKIDSMGRLVLSNTLLNDGTLILYVAAVPPSGVIRFNLTPRIYRMIYYNQWS